MNLNKYLNDFKGSNDKLLNPHPHPQKPDIPHTSKNRHLNNINKLNEMVSRNKIVSPKSVEKKGDEKDKEVISFLGNIASKFDEELENLTEIENLLINAKLDLKMSPDDCENEVVINSENDNILIAEKYTTDLTINKAREPLIYSKNSNLKNEKYITKLK